MTEQQWILAMLARGHEGPNMAWKIVGSYRRPLTMTVWSVEAEATLELNDGEGFPDAQAGDLVYASDTNQWWIVVDATHFVPLSVQVWPYFSGNNMARGKQPPYRLKS